MPSHDNTPLSVLIVDDEPHIRELLALLIQDLGFHPRTAQDGNDALRQVHDQQPHIVVTDIKMPGKDGIVVLREIKSFYPEVEVIMISGHGDMHLAIQSLKFEAADFITKPIDEELLTIALNKVAERIRLRAQVRSYTEHLERLVEEKSAALVEMERRFAATQIMEGMGRAMLAICESTEGSASVPPLPFYVALHDTTGTVIRANGPSQSRIGHRDGCPSDGIYAGRHNPKWISPFGEARQLRRPVQRQELIEGSDGQLLPVAAWISPVIDRSGNVELFLEILLDLSELRRLRDELERTQRKFQLLFDAVPCSITVQDRSLRVVEANAAFRRDFGAPNGQPCHQLFKKSPDACPECPVLATFADGQPHHHETVVTTCRGERRNILIWTAPLAGPSQEVEHVLEVATDITLIRALQDHLTSLGMMLGSMSHGLKGLLMALDGGIYRIDKGIQHEDWDRVRGGWATVRHRLDQIRKTVLDILYYSKSRKLELQVRSLVEVAQDLADMGSTRAREHSIEFCADTDAAYGYITIDDTAFTSAMANILENAVDACRMAPDRAEHRISLLARVEDTEAVLIVQDTGIGMDQATMDKMFTLFFSSKGALGTGIGMFVTHEVVQAHGGRIEVASTPGQGTTFAVRLPWRPAPTL